MASFPSYNVEGYYGKGNSRDAARQSQLGNKGTTISGSRALRFDMRPWVAKLGNKDKARAAMNQLADKMAKSAVSWMKANHPWENRSGNAEHMLHANVIHYSRDRTDVRLTHGVFYGKYLEEGTRKMRAYPIIEPAVERFGRTVNASMATIMRAQFG